MMLELLRAATSILWLALIVLCLPFARRAVFDKRPKPRDGILLAVGILAINREMFAAIAEFDPGDPDALALCYFIALVGGSIMAWAILWARRVDG